MEKRELNGMSSKRSENLLIYSSLAIFAIGYLACSLYFAGHTVLWMDEVLSVWASRQPSAKAVYSAIAHGSEFAPPVFPLLLHFLAKGLGGGYRVLRIPEITSVFVTGFCAFILIRRYFGLALGALGFCLLLEGLLPYVLNIRPYDLVTACFAVALVFWNDLEQKKSWWRYVAIVLFLALGISLHFYAVLLVPCLGGIEIFYSLKRRTFRPGVWIALFFAGASIFAWLPLISTMSHFVANDSGSPSYYAHPTIASLLQSTKRIFMDGIPYTVIVIFALVLIGVGRLLGREHAVEEPDLQKDQVGFWAIGTGIMLFPLIVFAFSVVVTKTFNARYCIATIIGAVAIVCGSIRINRFFRRTIPAILAVALVLDLGYMRGLENRFNYEPAVASIPGTCPIVIINGDTWFALMEQLPAAQRNRIVYLTLPTNVRFGDPTNEHQVERWKAINPDLPVEGVSKFLRQNPKFYAVNFAINMKGSDATQADYLLSRHLIQLVSEKGNALIYKSVPTSPATGGVDAGHSPATTTPRPYPSGTRG